MYHLYQHAYKPDIKIAFFDIGISHRASIVEIATLFFEQFPALSIVEFMSITLRPLLVCWKGQPNSYHTWIPEDTLQQLIMISEYYQELKSMGSSFAHRGRMMQGTKHEPRITLAHDLVVG